MCVTTGFGYESRNKGRMAGGGMATRTQNAKGKKKRVSNLNSNPMNLVAVGKTHKVREPGG